MGVREINNITYKILSSMIASEPPVKERAGDSKYQIADPNKARFKKMFRANNPAQQFKDKVDPQIESILRKKSPTKTVELPVETKPQPLYNPDSPLYKKMDEKEKAGKMDAHDVNQDIDHMQDPRTDR